MRDELTWTFIALPYFDLEDMQWKPSVKVLCNGAFFGWTIYDIGFDEARYTMPYARALMEQNADMHRLSMDDYLAKYRQNPTDSA